jgi:uncharacterized protein (TIGR02001 family)
MKTKKSFTLAALVMGAVTAAPGYANEFTANAATTNNYIWRGLTQTENNPAVQGGIDYAHDSGFYAGTWVSNVSYAPAGVFNYEHDMYAGFSGGSDTFSWDVGYLYYNYDDNARFDFGEVYGSIGFSGLSVSVNLLANTEADEAIGQDFGFGQAYYVSGDYGFEVAGGLELGVHVGYHDGDFNEAFNGVDGSYMDYNVSLSRGGFGFMVTGTDADGGAAESVGLDNDELKFVISYSVDFDLLSD